MPSGLVDIHCHGALGAGFGDDLAGTRTAVDHHRESGADRVVASLVTAAYDTLEAQVRVLAPLVAGGELRGIHLEGPFLSEARRGAHDPALLRAPDPGLVERLTSAASEAGAPEAIVTWTFAPELPGSGALVTALAAAGVLPAVGHTDADAATVRAALERVADATGRPALVTHLFNGMPSLHHRAGGPVAAALAAAARGEAVVELIADGVHVADEVVRMVFETVGPDAVALVSDAMAATGLGDGAYRLGTLDVDVRAGVARLAGTDGRPGSIAGSTSTLGDIARRCVELVGLPEPDVMTAAARTPVRVLARGG